MLIWRFARENAQDVCAGDQERVATRSKSKRKHGGSATKTLPPILELRGISKSFPGVKALDNVRFDLRPREIHTLMGENGAGKSTLIKVITGVHQPDSGEIYFEGQAIDFKSPRDSQRAGIAAIYQHSTSYPHLTVTENIFIGHEETTRFSKTILWSRMHARAQELLNTLGADFSAKTIISTLSIAQRQMVEVAKALSFNAKVIIMDEPTAALSRKESEELYCITEDLRDNGVGVLFISHRFEDMQRLASRVTVFRDARYVGTWPANSVTHDQVVMAMVGREVSRLAPQRKTDKGDVLLSVRNLSRTGYCADISFEVRAGEVVGFIGLVGSGRTELFEALLGIAECKCAEVLINGQSVRIHHPRDAMRLGVGYLPEDRQLQGLILDWGIDQNISLANLDQVSRKGWIDSDKERNMAKELAEQVGVKALSIFDKANSLSGGNQQKVVVAKLLAQKLNIFILDEPTKGIDIAAKQEVYRIVNDLTKQAYAVIMISSEMPEVLGMSDRIIVMREGRIADTMINDGTVTQEMILQSAIASNGKDRNQGRKN